MATAKQLDELTFTYQTRLDLTEQQSAVLEQMASLLSKAEHSLFADMNKGISLNTLKSSYIKQFQITARHFNAVRISLEGKIRSIESLQADNLKMIESKIKTLDKAIKSITKNPKRYKNPDFQLHHKKRALTRQQHKHLKLTTQIKASKVSLCFGSKKLFKQQFHLQDNGYASHQEWKQDWQAARQNQFLLVGSKDETMGNQSCIATFNNNHTLNLKLRVPDALAAVYGQYLTLEHVQLHYGKEAIIAALTNNLYRADLKRTGMQKVHGDLYKDYGQALTYRFVRDDKGWLVFITVTQAAPPLVTSSQAGALGVDINSDHLAVSEIDRKGNWIKSFDIPLVTYGKNTDQSLAAIGEAVATLTQYALKSGKPIVAEHLDFTNKKKTLSESSKKAARALSSFAYSKIILTLKAQCFRSGIGFHHVNPAYTSIIGRVKFARQYSRLSVHQAAAMVIARRLFNFSERLPHCWENIPDSKGGHVALPVLVKISSKHLWHSWAIVKKNFQDVHAAPYQQYHQQAGPVDLTKQEDHIPF